MIGEQISNLLCDHDDGYIGVRIHDGGHEIEASTTRNGCATIFCKRSSDVQKLTGAYGNIVEIPQQARSGVKIAARVLGTEEEKPQSGLAHAVQLLVRNAPER